MKSIVHRGDGIPYIDSKDPNSDEWFEFAWELASGETISSYAWLINGTVTGVGGETDALQLNEQSANDGALRVRLSGGTLGRHYTITSRIETNQQPQRDRSIRFKVVNL